MLFSNRKGFVCHQIIFWFFLHSHSFSEQTWNSRISEYFRKYRTEIHICTCVCFSSVNGWFIIAEYLQTGTLKCSLAQILAEIKYCTLSLEWWLFSTNNSVHTWKTIGTIIRSSQLGKKEYDKILHSKEFTWKLCDPTFNQLIVCRKGTATFLIFLSNSSSIVKKRKGGRRITDQIYDCWTDCFNRSWSEKQEKYQFLFLGWFISMLPSISFSEKVMQNSLLVPSIYPWTNSLRQA